MGAFWRMGELIKSIQSEDSKGRGKNQMSSPLSKTAQSSMYVLSTYPKPCVLIVLSQFLLLSCLDSFLKLWNFSRSISNNENGVFSGFLIAETNILFISVSNFEWILENHVVMAKAGLQLLLYLCYATRYFNYKNMDWVVKWSIDKVNWTLHSELLGQVTSVPCMSYAAMDGYAELGNNYCALRY